MTQDHSGKIVLFGGANGSGTLGDTWLYSAGWTQLSPSASPSARFGGSTAKLQATVDGVSKQRVVLFGGASSNSSVFDDTWLFALNDTYTNGMWTQLSLTIKPSARRHASIVPVPVPSSLVHQVMLFGGLGASPTYSVYSDTWLFS
jgi:hypothetical protein